MRHIKETDIEIYQAIAQEIKRQQENLELIASENIVSLISIWSIWSIWSNTLFVYLPPRKPPPRWLRYP